MDDSDRLYEVIEPRNFTAGRYPHRARTINHPPGNTYYATPRNIKPPSPPAPRSIPPVPPRNKGSSTDNGPSNSLPNACSCSPSDQWNGVGNGLAPAMRNRSTSASSQGRHVYHMCCIPCLDSVIWWCVCVCVHSHYPAGPVIVHNSMSHTGNFCWLATMDCRCSELLYKAFVAVHKEMSGLKVKGCVCLSG